MLRRIERGADIDDVLLSIYWHKPADTSATHPLKDLCRDVVVCAQNVGHGLELVIERFKRKVDEEKKRAVMRQSVWRTTLDMLYMVEKAEPQRNGRSDADLLASVLAVKPELAHACETYTCGKYWAVAAKIADKCKPGLSRWELTFQCNALLDGIALLRAAVTAATKPE